MDFCFLERVVFVKCEADWERAGVFPGHFVVADGDARGVASVLGGGGVGGYVPFYVGGTGHEGDVV